MTPVGEARLRARVATIVARAHVPQDQRDDIADELLSHLVERVEAETAAGSPEDEAVDRAITALGSAAVLARDFGRAYHSRLWASTIGVLLPPTPDIDARPGVIRWLRALLAVDVVLSCIGLAGLAATETPLRILVGGIALAAGIAAAALAFVALARGQRWALYFAIGLSAAIVVNGIRDIVQPVQPGAITIPLLAIVAAAVLLSVWQEWPRLVGFVADSALPHRLLVAGLVLALVAPLTVPPALAAVGDPTQASVDDLDLRLSMACERGALVVDGDPVLDETTLATLRVDVSWRRGDLLPGGLDGLLNPSHLGDTAGWRSLPQGPWWDWIGAPEIVDTVTGEPAGTWGSTVRSVVLLPSDVAGGSTIVVDASDISAGHPIRATWSLFSDHPAAESRGHIEFFYAHLDRFLVAATVGCGETATAREVPVPAGGG